MKKKSARSSRGTAPERREKRGGNNKRLSFTLKGMLKSFEVKTVGENPKSSRRTGGAKKEV